MLLLTALASAQPTPPSTPAAAPQAAGAKFGVGITYDLGFVPSDVSIGWAGQLFVSVGAAVGFSCFGGRAAVIPEAGDVILGVETTYCRAISFRVDAESRAAGFFVGVREEVDDGQYASFQLGFGYSGGAIPDLDTRWEGMYVRPRGSMMIERGPLAFDIGPFIELPVLLTQKVEGDGIGPGMLVRIGVELTAYVGRFEK